MIYLTNAFSLNMLPGLLPQEEKEDLDPDARLALGNQWVSFGHPARVEIIPIDDIDVRGYLDAREWVSAVGHASTAAVFSDALGVTIPANRLTVQVQPGDLLIIGQYSGPRLEEGATTLPEGATIRWFSVEVRQYESWQEWEDAAVFSGPHEGE